MILSSILLADTNYTFESLTPTILENIHSFKQRHADLDHIFFNNQKVEEMLIDSFGDSVLDAYRQLVPYAYKSDLARYCILFKYGGVYADISYFFLSTWYPLGDRLSIFRDTLTASPWDTANGVIAAPAGHKALAKAIDLVCANVTNRYYGVTPLCTTGPTLFGKAIALTCEPEDLNLGEATFVTASNTARCLMSRSGGEVVAIRRKTVGGSIEELGINDGNNYNILWDAREIFGMDADQLRTWSAKWLYQKGFTVGRLQGGSLHIEGTEAHYISWGPYTHLGPGKYEASIELVDGPSYGSLVLDVSVKFGSEVLAREKVSLDAGNKSEITCNILFNIQEDTSSLEVRLRSEGPYCVGVKQVTIRRVSEFGRS